MYKLAIKYDDGDVEIVKFYAPNDYLAAFSLILCNRPTLSSFEEYEKEELYEIINNYKTVEELVTFIIKEYYEGCRVDETPILLLNENTNTVLYDAGTIYTSNFDDYEWEENE